MEARLEARFAHMEGPCGVAYAGRPGQPGAYDVLTAGADCAVRVRHAGPAGGGGGGAEEEGLREAVAHQDAVNAVAVHRATKLVVTGGVDGHVKVHDLDTLEFVGNATRFALPVRAVAFAPSGRWLAAGGDDESVKVVKITAQGGYKVKKTLKLDGKSVKALAFDPDDESYLAAAFGDGVVQVWGLEDSRTVCSLKGAFPRVGADAPAVPRGLCWDPDGALLAVPGNDNDVVFYDRLSWKVSDEVELSGEHSQPVAMVSLSPNGRYALTAGEDKKLVLWDMVRKEAVATRAMEATVVGVDWHPEDNSAAVVDEQGQWAEWVDLVPAGLPDIHSTVDDPSVLAGADVDAADEAAAEEDAAGGAAPDRVAGPAFQFSVGLGALERKMQAAIQPGATPVSDDSKYRFLAYDINTGYITSSTEIDHNTVHIAFHNPSKGGIRNPTFKDFNRFHLAAMGDHGAAFASEQREDDVGAVLQYQPFDAWTAKGEWSHYLPLGEAPVAVAAGASFVALATQKYVRLFSHAGIQIALLNWAKPVVALAAKGSQLLVLSHRGLPFKAGGADLHQPQLESVLFDVPRRKELFAGTAPVGPNGEIHWAGFSREGLPAVCDSAGTVSVLVGDFGGQWVPVYTPPAADTARKWVVGLSDKELYFFLPKEGEAPSVQPPPTLRTQKLQMPVVDGPEKAMQEAFLRQQTLSQHYRTAGEEAKAGACSWDADKALLQILKDVLRQDNLDKGFDVVRYLTTTKALKAAMQMANKLRKQPLAEKIKGIVEEQEALYGGTPLAAAPPASQSLQRMDHNASSQRTAGADPFARGISQQYKPLSSGPSALSKKPRYA